MSELNDFAKTCKKQDEEKALQMQVAAKAISSDKKLTFTEARLNKDNLWNLIFAAILFVGLFSALTISQAIGHIIGGISLIIAIILVKKNSNIEFDKEKFEFTSIDGNKFRTHGVFLIWRILVIGFASIATSGFLTKSLDIENIALNNLILSFFFAFFFGAFSILRNFPVAVFFKKEAWISDGNHNTQNNVSKPMLSLTRLRTDPINNYYSGNIYHKR